MGWTSVMGYTEAWSVTWLIQAWHLIHFKSALSLLWTHCKIYALMPLEFLQEELHLVLPQLSSPPHGESLRKTVMQRGTEKDRDWYPHHISRAPGTSPAPTKISCTPWISQFQDPINCLSICWNQFKFSFYCLQIMGGGNSDEYTISPHGSFFQY